MPASDYSWDTEFSALFDRSLKKYRAGERDPERLLTAADRDFLAAIGCKPREFFDFVEDHCEYDGDPSAGTALLVAAARRDYFLTIQHGRALTTVVSPESLPAKTDPALGGIPWLARIVVKARAKLRGELDPEIMYGCGGDRSFLSERGVHPADFLRAVWAAGDDDTKVLDWLQAQQLRE
jgi:hypothetical protein